MGAFRKFKKLPLRGGGSAGYPKKDKRRVRRGSREQKQI